MNDNEKSGINIHLIIALLIFVVIGICFYKLWKWDKSGNVVLEEVESGSYDYESLDMVFNVDKDILDAHGDDGVNRVLCIGDYVWNITDSRGKGFADYIRDAADSEIIVLSDPDAKVSDVQNSYDNDSVTVWQASCLYDTVKAICKKDYTLQREAYERGDILSEDYMKTLESIDMDSIDTAVIFFGTHDYIGARTLYNPNDKFDTSTYEGALRASINLIQQEYPHIRIIVVSPFLHGVIKEETVVAASLMNYGNGNLSEYVMRLYNVSMECCVSFLDLYFGLINEDNLNDYCLADVLNDNGIELIGNHITEYFKRKY